MPSEAPNSGNLSSHPDFPNNTEVICNSSRSRYFGQRGVVYGSGPSRSSTSTAAVLYVRWPDGERYKYFPNSVSPAPKKENEYRVSHSIRNGRKVQVHEVPASRRPRPTIFQQIAAQRDNTTH